MQDIISTGQRVKNPETVVEGIFNKILSWKKKAGDLDQ